MSEDLKNILALIAILFPWAVLGVIGFIGFVILVYKEEDTISPHRLLHIYRRKFVELLKGHK